MARSIVTLSVGFLFVLNASATLIDFEDNAVAAAATSGAVPVPLASGNFSFNYGPEPVISFANNLSGARNDTTYLLLSGGSQLNTLTMQKGSGQTFNLNSLDVAEFNNNFSTNIIVTGFLAGGGTVSKTITLDTQQYQIGTHTGFETVSFDTSWSGLSSVTFEGVDSRTPTTLFAIDNISVDVVPEPATLAFVGIFGAGLWFVRRYFPSV